MEQNITQANTPTNPLIEKEIDGYKYVVTYSPPGDVTPVDVDLVYMEVRRQQQEHWQLRYTMLFSTLSAALFWLEEKQKHYDKWKKAENEQKF